jgi:hypothetical protein
MGSHRKSDFPLVRFRIALWLAAMLEIGVAPSFAIELALNKARWLALIEASRQPKAHPCGNDSAQLGG